MENEKIRKSIKTAFEELKTEFTFTDVLKKSELEKFTESVIEILGKITENELTGIDKTVKTTQVKRVDEFGSIGETVNPYPCHICAFRSSQVESKECSNCFSKNSEFEYYIKSK